ncbi:hypothetical protein F5X96DRAFT_44646 [Biscogniauxia mediterranea]|nr:hypothetical protein F5X96DRAFT_44646 [Biscogniauxia mediterranea]
METLLPAEAVEDFMRNIRLLASDGSYQRLQAVIDENHYLKGRNESMAIANDENIRSITRLRQELDEEGRRVVEKDSEIERLTNETVDLGARLADAERREEEAQAQIERNIEEIARLQTTLDEAQQRETEDKSKIAKDAEEILKLKEDVVARDMEISNLQSSLEQETSNLTETQAAEDRVKQELAAVSEDLQVKNTKLSQLDGFAFHLRKQPREEIRAQLHGIFESMYRFAELNVGKDLEQAVLANPSLWDKLQNHGQVKRVIPMPMSNSAEAKKMRVAAVVAILGSLLSRYIFQRTYHLEDSTELSDLMSDLACCDPAREGYLRAVLLGVLPDTQRLNGKLRVKKVVDEVLACIEPLLPEGKQKAARASLEKACSEVCSQWMQLQKLEDWIEPSYEVEYGNEDEWKLLPLHATDDDANHGNGAPQQPNGDGEHAATAGYMGDIVTVAWPSFLSPWTGDPELEEGPEVAAPGFVLTKDQMRRAREEESALLWQGTRRARRNSRRSRARSFTTVTDDDGGHNGGGGSRRPFLHTAEEQNGIHSESG